MKFARRNARGGAPEPRGLDGCCGAAPPSRAVAAARGRVALAEIKQTIADQPSYGYRRVHALIRRCRREQRGRRGERARHLTANRSYDASKRNFRAARNSSTLAAIVGRAKRETPGGSRQPPEVPGIVRRFEGKG
jgi:hypothetical protein